MDDPFVSKFVEQVVSPQEFVTSGDKVDITAMESDTTFKDSVGTADSNNEPPLSLYAEMKGSPYTVKFLNIDFWNEMTPELEFDGISENVKFIEKYVSDEIQNRGFEDTTNSYKDIMTKIMNSLNINPNETVDMKIKRISTYIKLLTRTKEKEKQSSELIKKLRGAYG